MPLVDYPLDDEDEDEAQDEEDDAEHQVVHQIAHNHPPSTSTSSLASTGPFPSEEGPPLPLIRSDVGMSSRLPDASELFASFDSRRSDPLEASFPSTSSATVGTTASRKRPDLNGSTEVPHRKIPRGTLLPSRIPPDTAHGSLIPPQLRGRSNIATEDLDRLFTKRKPNGVL